MWKYSTLIRVGLAVTPLAASLMWLAFSRQWKLDEEHPGEPIEAQVGEPAEAEVDEPAQVDEPAEADVDEPAQVDEPAEAAVDEPAQVDEPAEAEADVDVDELAQVDEPAEAEAPVDHQPIRLYHGAPDIVPGRDIRLVRPSCLEHEDVPPRYADPTLPDVIPGRYKRLFWDPYLGRAGWGRGRMRLIEGVVLYRPPGGSSGGVFCSSPRWSNSPFIDILNVVDIL